MSRFTTTCARCGGSFGASRSDARYCSTRCRVSASQARLRAATVRLSVTEAVLADLSPHLAVIRGDSMGEHRAAYAAIRSRLDAPDTAQLDPNVLALVRAAVAANLEPVIH